ncbi:MAG: VWA domain-containing protein, partial [Chloroflexota bacterium]
PGNDVLLFIDDIEVGSARAGDSGEWNFTGFVPAGQRIIRAVVVNTLGQPELESGSVGFNIGQVTADLEIDSDSAENGFLRILFTDPTGLIVSDSGGESETEDDSSDDGLNVDISLQGSPAVALILDASWSMTLPLDSDEEDDRLAVDDPDSRIQIAKSAINSFIENNLPEGSPVAVRAFGNIEGDLSCRTDLMLPLQPVTKDTLRQIIDEIEPQFNANTALAASLAASADDLSDTDREKVIVLLTDGAETCEGDPAAEIEALVADGVDLRVNIIGFAISDPALKAQFETWAALGNGQFIDAQDAESLSVALRETLTVVYRVIDDSGSIVASGVVGGLPIELEPGSYTVQLDSTAGSSLENVIITPGGIVELVSSVQ